MKTSTSLDAEPCSYCGSIDGLTPTGEYAAADPLDGTTLRRVVADSTDLTNPRLSEVDWDNAALQLDAALGLDDLRHLAGFDRLPPPAIDVPRLVAAIDQTLPFERWINVEVVESIARAYATGAKR
jgi:hypothetical protein